MALSLTPAALAKLMKRRDNPTPYKCGPARSYGDTASEADIQCLIVDWLRAHGYLVLETGHYVASQRKVNDNGLPDLVVRHTAWPQGAALLLEVKTPTGVLRVAQAQWHKAGGSFVVRSLEAALAALAKFEYNTFYYQREPRESETK